MKTQAAFTQSMADAGLQNLGAALGGFLKAMPSLTVPPSVLTELQADYLKEATALWNSALGAGTPPASGSSPLKDRRFAAREWLANPGAAFNAQLYLLNARTLMQLADAIEGEEKLRQRVRFAVQQWVAAASPSNCLATNPEALARAVETQGGSLSQGMAQLWNDVQQGHVSQTDERLFEVGRNVATTEGSVVHECELFQLIEYKPLTAKVYERPLLIVPPCINKYYILDLQPANSLVRYALEQGHRVFMVSWRNAEPGMEKLTWDDYIEDAAIRAIDITREIAGTDKLNTLGFCIGGTILATALSVLAQRGEKPAASMTLLTAFLDFSDTGVLDLFVDETMVKMREMTIGEESPNGGGLLKGQELSTTFSSLRPNDLVWNYVVGNYLKGEIPPAFDLLYWNSDSTNLPGPMYCWYLRNTYLENKLVKPGAAMTCGVPVDFGRIDAPTYLYASREDHIVPWNSAYRSTQALKGAKGKIRFVLGASGHIAGVINPPAANKRSHWVGASGTFPDHHDDWLAKAKETPGSWWPDWSGWLQNHAGKQVAAPKTPGSRKYRVVEPAPGRYVKQKA